MICLMRALTLLALLALFLPANAHAKPGFDCSKASTRAEKVICLPENNRLQELDNRLSKAYQRARATTDARYLRTSQRKWLTYRDKACQQSNDRYIAHCLAVLYGARINELEQGLVSYPVLMSELPYRFKIADKLSGQLKYHVTEKKMSKWEITKDFKLTLHTDKGEQVLWTGSEYRGGGIDITELKWVKIHLYKNQHILFEVMTHAYGGHATSSSIYDTSTHTYVTYTGSGVLRYQGEMHEGKQGRGHSTMGLQWIPGEPLDLLYTGSGRMVGDYSYIGPNHRERYSINFNGSPWITRKVDITRDLEKDDKPTAYLALFKKIDSGIKQPEVKQRHNKPVESCVEHGIDWVEVTRGIGYWLTFAIQAQQEGMSYAQAYYALPRLVAHNKEFTLTPTQLALAQGLDYYRKQIESTSGWKDKLAKAIQNPDDIVDRTLQSSGLPDIKNQCARDIYLPRYDYLRVHNWLYTFWARRYRDGSYDIAKVVISEAVKRFKQ